MVHQSAVAAYVEEELGGGHQPMSESSSTMGGFDPVMLVGIVAPLCFIVGAVSARLFMSSMRRDQMDVLLSRKLNAHPLPDRDSRPPAKSAVAAAAVASHYGQESSMVAGEDEEYSEGFDAADIMQATSKAAAMQHAMARRVEQRRTTSTLNAVGGDPALIRSIVAASRATRAQQQMQRGLTPPLKR